MSGGLFDYTPPSGQSFRLAASEGGVYNAKYGGDGDSIDWALQSRDKFTAELAGYLIQIEELGETIKNNIVRHRYAPRPGADLSNMGADAPTCRIKCWWIGDDFEAFQDFAKAIVKTDLIEFIHPVYGLVEGMVESCTVNNYYEGAGAMSADIEFVKQMPAGSGGELMDDIEVRAEALYEKGIAEQYAQASGEARKAVEGAATPPAMDKSLDPAKTILEQYNEAVGPTREFVKECDRLEGLFTGTLADITLPASTILTAVEFTTDLPGRMLEAVANTVARYTEAYQSLQDAPEQFMESFSLGITKLRQEMQLDEPTPMTQGGQAQGAARAMARKHLMALSGQHASLTVAYAYSRDDARMSKARRIEKAQAFDIEGNYLRPDAMPQVMDVTALERSVASVRAWLLECMADAREVQTLREHALALLRHVNRVKIDKRKLRTVWVDAPTHLLLVMHREGLPYTMLPRIMALNPEISDPGAVEGEVKLYVAA